MVGSYVRPRIATAIDGESRPLTPCCNGYTSAHHIDNAGSAVQNTKALRADSNN